MPECRTPVMTMVEASWVDQSGALRSVPARMEDRSAGGACIRVKMPIGVGSKLRIQWRFEQFSGTAKYCRSEGREYLVGIQRDTTKDPLTQRPRSRRSFHRQSRKYTEAAREQAERNSRSGSEGSNCARVAYCATCRRIAYARRGSRNGRRGEAPRFTARGIQCASTESI